jgi:hypothetical protein
MKRLWKKIAFFAAVSLIALTAPAQADALPKEILGEWCLIPAGENEVSTRYERRKCKNAEGYLTEGFMTVKRNETEYWESGCKFTSVTTRFQTLWESGYQRSKQYKLFEVKARCAGEGEWWNATLYFDLLYDGTLEHKMFNDNELPDEFVDKTVCKTGPKLYVDSDGGGCDGIRLIFERDRYRITDRNGEGVGFCRYASVKTVWNDKLGVATKLQGGTITYLTAQCGSTQKLLAIWEAKGTIYVEDKGR